MVPHTEDLNDLSQIAVSNNYVPLTSYDEQENLCDIFRPIHSQCTKNFVDLQRWDTFFIWNNTSYLGSHHVLPMGRCPSKILETFEFKPLACQIVFSSHSLQCFQFLPKVLLFSLGAFLMHQNSLLCFADQPLCMY